MCVASYSLRRIRGTTIAAELAFVRCLIYFKNDVCTKNHRFLVNCYCKLPMPYVAAIS